MIETRFWLQPTKSFPDGAPQREEFLSDEEFDAACRQYAREWKHVYRCVGCVNPDCPQHGVG